MEPKSDGSLDTGNRENHTLDQTLGQHANYAKGAGPQSARTHLYFGQDRPNEIPPHPTIPTIPEGATVLSSVIPMNEKSPSPPHSSATTTGTTSTPTSIGNVSSGEGIGKGPGPDFPREGLALAPGSQSVNPPLDHDTWSSMQQRYELGRGQEDPYEQSSQHSQPQQQSRYNPANFPSALKLLVSNNVAGSIIGRGGQTISELQEQSSTRIKLSQTNDYYPATQDRVCLIQGEPDQVKTALRLLLERLYMLQEHQHSQHMAWQLQRQRGAAAPTFDFVVRLLVPSSSCGMIIGKSGSNIKYLEDNAGVSSVRLSPKEGGEGGYAAAAVISATSERIVTITGPSMDSCLKCLHLIVDGMATHPDICRYSNMTTSYSRVVPDAYGHAGRPLLMTAPPGPTRLSTSEPIWEGNPIGFADPGVPGIARRVASSPDLAGVMIDQRRGLGPEPQTPERLSGYAASVRSASSYSPVHVTGSQSPALHGASSVYLLSQMGSHQSAGLLGHSPPEALASVGHSASAPDLLAVQLDQSLFLAPVPPSQPPPQDYANSFIPQAPTMVAPGCFSAQALVPESMVGSILGRQGRTLNELQMLSSTRIRISQRGEYMPGTRSRIVSVRGPTAHAVWQAQFMMSQRMILPPTATSSVPPRIAQTSATMNQSPISTDDPSRGVNASTNAADQSSTSL